jgi:serine/threonine protein phosphatase PrpC
LCVKNCANTLTLYSIGKLSDGSTLVVAVVTREGMVHSCWLGDSRVLLGHADGTYTALTNDHKPDMPSERQRIEAIGGKVSEKEGGTARVEGVLAMSR